MADKVVSVRLQAEVEGFTGGMRKAKASVDDLTKAAAPSKADAFKKMGDKAALAGAAVAVGIGVAVKRFADFDEAMSAVQANSGETGAALNDLRELAIKLGADSQFSAKEAAQGINELAKAGVKTKDILGGGLKGSLDLAAAGQIGVAQAAETAATAMVQFNLEGAEVPHIADLLTNAANKAQGGVGDMAAALKQSGLVAAATGLTLEETTAGLTAFASAGLIGSDAGTSFKTMLQRLSAPTNEAAAAMKEYGISAYDANGQFVGLEAVAGQLKDGMEKLDPATRNAAMATIFGSDAVRAANVLFNEGAEGIAKWTTEVTEQGSAAKQAAILTDNLNGDIERLGGAFDSVLIEGGSAANGSLRTLVQTLTSFVDYAGKIPGPIMLGGAAIASIVLLAPKGVTAFRNYTKQLDTLGISFERLEIRAPRLASGLKNVAQAGALFAVAATAVYAFADATEKINADKLAGDLTKTSDGLSVINKELAATADNGWGRVGSDIDSFGKALGAAFDPGIVNNIDNAIGSFKTVFGGENVSNIQNATKQLDGIDKALSALVSGGEGERAAAIFAQMATEAKSQGISVDELQRKFPGYVSAMANAGTQAKASASDVGLMASSAEELKKQADVARKALDDLKSAIEGMGGPVAAQRAATRDYEAALDTMTDSLKDEKDALVDAKLKKDGVTDATKAQQAAAEKWADGQLKVINRLNDDTEAGRKNAANLDDIRAKTLAKAAADYEVTESTKGTTEATKVATDTIKKGRDEFINAAVAAGRTKDEAVKLADKLGLIPKNVKIIVGQTGASEVEATLQALARNRTATIFIKKNQVDGDTGRIDRTSGGARAGFATGGPVFGPGTGTSDTAGIYALSNNEHVLTAAEVAKAGGHGAIFAMRKAIRDGRMGGLAAGGPAGPIGRPAPMLGGAGIDYDRLAKAMIGARPNVTANLTSAAGLDARQVAREIAWGLT